MGQLDADALEREGWSLCRTFQKDKDTMVYEVKKPSDFPTIEERKTGKWTGVEKEDGSFIKIEECWCDNCFNYAPLMPDDSYPNFCPHCGADMRGEQK